MLLQRRSIQPHISIRVSFNIENAAAGEIQPHIFKRVSFNISLVGG
jgi:hypothetical protein